MVDVTLIDRDLAGNSVLVRRGLAMVLALVLLAALLTAAGRGTFSRDVAVQTELDDIGGALVVGSDVKVNGNIVGRVSGIGAGAKGVRVDMTVKAEAAKRIPRQLQARVMPASVFGTTYVDLVAVASAQQTIGLLSGTLIPQDRSVETVELQHALDSTDRLLGAVRPADLSVTLGALAQTLNGNGDNLGRTLEATNQLLTKVQPQLPNLKNDLGLFATNMMLLSDVLPNLFNATGDALVTARTVVKQKNDVSGLLARGTVLTGESQAAITKLHKDWVRALNQSAVVVRAMFDQRGGFPASYLAFTGFAAKQMTTFTDGPWMSTNVFIKTGDDAPYTAADCPVYGTAKGPNCAGASSPTRSTSAASMAAPDDAELIEQLRGLMSGLAGGQK